ncbi:MAG: type II toxin-antitoxin system VapC family toxin [Thermomicrobiales bacterium]|nr:type II toxin-antitoxin system VapC family toxin [Thermomicrobiales bacterium]
MNPAFLDTNIFVYHLTNNHPDHSPRCSALLAEVEAGALRAYTSVTAIDETLRVLTKAFGHDRAAAGEMFSLMLTPPDIQIDHRDAVLNAIEFWTQQSPLSFVDCFHLALTAELGLSEIYSFDKKMDRYPGVERIEPE